MIVFAAGAVSPVLGQWPQWGGPNRDFTIDSAKLADTWPESGPKTLWSRSLGDGYAAIIADAGRIYTGYRAGEDEVFAALDADSGKTVWEHRYAAPLPEKLVAYFGKGPNATPLLVGDNLITIGITGKMFCLDIRDGSVRWKKGLWDELDGTRVQYGYSSSPLEWKDSVLVPVGGDGRGLVAFRIKDGSIKWSSGDFKNSFSSPVLIDLDGQTQVVVAMGAQVVGYDPDNGSVLWSHHHQNQWDCNISQPVFGGDDILYVSSFGNCGARAIKLTRGGGKTSTKELWLNPKHKIGLTTTQRIGDYIYGSVWDSRGFMSAINVKTGKVAWKSREIGKAQILRAGDKLLLLDEDGTLALAKATPKKLEVLAKAGVLSEKAWTVPTLVGSRLYLRDRKTIKAIDLQ